ncbi:hypothetical protein DAEQUDRAFT_760771 [Daedalea quercina L-15889]|uniref:Uncharacterized protein n=1 Tax=Daedalea quercina L-15889 TaxID=1314783 RepID=A0A165UDC8_9APHY|nr:hypothetical protein DAEQUDRAFT_760771 [Daedalea quercina L-15889]
MAGVAAAFTSLSSDHVVQYILADIPFFCVGILSLGVFTFFIFMKRADSAVSLLFCLHMSAVIAFVSSILDVVQLLIRGPAEVDDNTGLDSVSGLTAVREVGFALSFGLRFLFFWGFVAQPPPGEARPEGNAIHNGSWRRWGLLGLVLEMFTLALVLIDPVLQILYRLVASLHNIGPLYEIEAAIQVVLSVIFILKILLNCWVKMLVNGSAAVPIRKALAGYSAVITALILSGLIGIGNVAMFEFTETVGGRFLQAIELYILIVFMLSYAFYHLRRRSWGNAPKTKQQQQQQQQQQRQQQQQMSPIQRAGSFRGLPDFKLDMGRPVISSPELLRVIGRDVEENRRPTLLQRASVASRMSSWMNIRRLSERIGGRSGVPSVDLEKARLWYHGKGGHNNYDVYGAPPDSAIDVGSPTQPKQNPGYQDPVFASGLPMASPTSTRSMSPMVPNYYGGASAAPTAALDARRSVVLSRALSPEALKVTVPPPTHSRSASIDPGGGDEVAYAIYEESPRSAICSPLSGIDEIIEGYDDRALRPPSTPLIRSARSSRISELIRQQEELDKSIVALRLFSPTGDGDTTSTDSRPLSMSNLGARPPFLSEKSSSGDTRATRSTQSDLSLSSFPDPPKSGIEAGFKPADAPPVPPLSRDNSTRSMADDVVWKESVVLEPEPAVVRSALSRPESQTVITGKDALRHNRHSSQALSVNDPAMLLPGTRNHVNSGGTQYEITSFIGRLTQEPGSFASSSVLNGSDDGHFVPPFARSHGPSSSYGSARSLRPLILPESSTPQRISINQTVPQSSRSSTASDEQASLGSPEGRTSPSSVRRRAFTAPNSRFNGPVGLPPRPRLAAATAARDLLTPVQESPASS